MPPTELSRRQAIIDRCRWMNATGLNQGTSGNISVRYEDRMLITPTQIAYEDLKPAMITAMRLEGTNDDWIGTHPPSSEWRFHLDILRTHPAINAVVHTHAVYATAVAMARKDIPPVHYMIAAFGGPTIRCAPYATFGTQTLSDLVLKALEDRLGCLLANHGMITIGSSLQHAAWLAVELETLARQYILSMGIEGGPKLLSETELAEAAQQFGLKYSP